MINLLVVLAIILVVLHVRLARRRRGYADPVVLARDAGVAALLLYLVIEGSSFVINVAWWRGLGQLDTYWQYLRIEWLPQTAGAIIGIAALILCFRAARARANSQIGRTRLFAWGGHALAILIGGGLAFGLLDPWTIALYLGSAPGAAGAAAYHDPLFGHGLTFYMFRLPFYEMIFGWLAALVILGLVIYCGALAIAGSSERMRDWRERIMAQAVGGYQPRPVTIHREPPPPLSLAGLVRSGAVLLLILFAVAEFFSRYSLLYSSHNFLYGADYVDARWGVPFYWAQIIAALLLALAILLEPWWNPPLRLGDHDFGRGLGGVTARRFPQKSLAAAAGAAFLAILVIPPAVEALVRQVYVRPNELTLERPYIADHIHATWMAYNIAQTSTERAFTPAPVSTLDLSQYPNTTDNLRLWDWRPFQENVTQLQALRPYYTFPDVDVDRYRINGRLRQVLIAARALDTGLLPDQAQTWVNLNFQYTHGYGAVAALANAANSEGQPELFLRDAPPVSSLPEFQIKQPDIYFGEEQERPVFVDTLQQEFDYPKGDDNAYSSYAGSGGIAMGNWGMRLAAAVDRNDWNILLTENLTSSSRLLLRRQITGRVHRLAPFLMLDPDPYLVVAPDGRLFWMMDAYTQSDLHPYAEPLDIATGPGADPQSGAADSAFGGFNSGETEVNYLRNSVKITVDAYNGDVRLYDFDPRDPILNAYRRVFPHLFLPRAAMPPGLLAHIRYPETLFDAQAQIYRTYHMQDPRVFYNKEDKWDIAKQVDAQEGSRPTEPYYVTVQLPGESQAEFVLMLPFTPANRDNLIAWIAARCDPDHYGQILFYRLPKDQLIYGPLQIESRVSQNPDISKDLSLWNQQGSRVIRINTLVLPVGNTFLYVEPIYIQATQAHLPELKKIVLALGDRLVYADSLPQAVAELAAPPGGNGANAGNGGGTGGAPAAMAAAAVSAGASLGVPTEVLRSIQAHMEQYQKLTAAGDYAAAGRELQAVNDELRRALTRTKSAK